MCTRGVREPRGYVVYVRIVLLESLLCVAAVRILTEGEVRGAK
jgi:hypothetical protein